MEPKTRAGHGRKGAYSETDDILLLDEYMPSGDWLKDFEADERGEIKKRQKRSN